MNTSLPTKSTGDTLSAAEINDVAKAVNSKRDDATLIPKNETQLSATNVSGGVSLAWTDTNDSLGNNNNIVVIGSSTSAGNGASSYANAYVGLLTAWLQSNYKNQVITNLAVGGYTSYNLMPTGYTQPNGRPAPDTARNITAALGLNPKLIIMNIPTNDVANGYTYEEYMGNLAVIYKLAKDAGVRMLITTTQPRNLGNPGQSYLIGEKGFITNMFGTDVLDFFTPIANTDGSIKSNLDSGDGIHVNDSGHLLLFNVVKSAVQTIIEANIKVLHKEVERFDFTTNTWTVVNNNLNRLANTYNATGLSSNTFYAFRIKTVTAFGTAYSGQASLIYTGTGSNPTPIVSVTPSNSVINSGTSASFTASSNVSGSTFKWYDAATAGNVLATTATFTTPALSAGATYYAEATSPTGVVSSRVPVSVTIASSTGSKRVLLDLNLTDALGNTTQNPIAPTPSPDVNGNYWNNFDINNGGNSGAMVYPLAFLNNPISTDNTVITGLSLKTNAASGTPNTNGTYGNGNGSGATVAVGDYPLTATQDAMFYDPNGGIKTLTLAVPTGKTAAIKLWGSRNATGPRILQVRKQGETTWQEMECAQNTSFTQAITFTGITGTQIFEVQVKAGSAYGYINVVDITLT